MSDRVLLFVTSLYLCWILLWQYSKFVRGEFTYHDLTIISDFFSNGLIHGRPFWVTDEQRSHLRLHFTPSLLVWLPAFIFAKTQFALIAVTATSVAAGIFITTREQYSCLTRAGVLLGWKVLLVGTYFICFAFNRYTLRVLSSAHFEPVFILTAALLLVAVRRGCGYRSLLPLLLLALGVRQE